MIISACVIVKDDSELESFKRSVESYLPYVDEVNVVANGKNVKGIKKYCESKKLNYKYQAWTEDFSAARNTAFQMAKKDANFIYWQDADDILVGGEYLRDIAKTALETKKDLVFLTYWYGCEFDEEGNMTQVTMQHPRERLIRPNSNIWQGRLHETPVPNGCEVSYTHVNYSKELPIAIMHTAKEENLPDKMERNMRILELQLEDEKLKGEADPRTLLYLMKIYNELDVKDLWVKCLDFGREYIGKSGWDMERGVCWDIMAQCVAKLGDNKTSIIYWFNSLREYPFDPFIYLRLASGYFNLKLFRQSFHWLEIALKQSPDLNSSGIVNIKGMKVLAAETMLKLYWNAKRDVNKAVEAATMLYKEVPTDANKQNLAFLYDMKDLSDTCERIDKACEYLESIDDLEAILRLIESLPASISAQPFAIKWLQKVSKPRKWADNEICYFANFGQKHFEQWGPESLEKGIGGSETAVIRLSEEWAKKGFKVTVYGDPGTKKEVKGVTWLPYYYFNKDDEFNVFIQWRSAALAGKVKCKKFLVDLHDLYSGLDFTDEQIENVDKFMVKSNYHRKLAPNIPDSKFAVISNGIDL